MSIIKVRSSTKWTKDTYGLYRSNVKRKKSKRKSGPKGKFKPQSNAKPNIIRTESSYYKDLKNRGKTIMPNTDIPKMTIKFLKRCTKNYLNYATVEKIFESYLLCNNKGLTKESKEYFIHLQKLMVRKSLPAEVINKIITHAAPTEKLKPKMLSAHSKSNSRNLKKTNNVQQKLSKEELDRRKLNRLALQPNYTKSR